MAVLACSPTPVDGASDGMMWTSTFAFDENGGDIVRKLLCVTFPPRCRWRPLRFIEAEHDAAMDLRLNPAEPQTRNQPDDSIYGVLAVIGHGDFNGIRNGGYRVNARGDPSPFLAMARPSRHSKKHFRKACILSCPFVKCSRTSMDPCRLNARVHLSTHRRCRYGCVLLLAIHEDNSDSRRL